MKNELKNYGIYGDESPSVTSDFLNLVSIDSSCRKHNWIIKPHFHSNLYQFFFISSGSGQLIIEEKSKPFKDVNLIIIPENTLHGFEFKEDIKGYTLSVSSKIIEKIILQDKELFHQINRTRLLNLNNYLDEFKDIMDSVNRMAKEFNLKAEKETLFLETLLLLLIIKIFRMAVVTEKVFTISSRELSYYNVFVKMIRQKMPTNFNIANFTQKIGISKTHLNRVCQAVAGTSSKEIINKYLINESMILMAHTNMTVSEIAYQLEFKDVSYFCRFFRKQVGFSPAKYRDQYKNIEQSDHPVALNY